MARDTKVASPVEHDWGRICFVSIESTTQIDRFCRFCTAYVRNCLQRSMDAFILKGTLAPPGEYDKINHGRRPSRKEYNQRSLVLKPRLLIRRTVIWVSVTVEHFNYNQPLFGPCLFWPNGRPSQQTDIPDWLHYLDHWTIELTLRNHLFTYLFTYSTRRLTGRRHADAATSECKSK